MKRLLILLVGLMFSALALAAINVNTATLQELEALNASLTEANVGKGQNRWKALGDSASAGWPFHIYSFPSLPAGKTSYPLCLTARTTGEALQVGYTFTSTPNLAPRPGTERTSTFPPCASVTFLTVARPRPMPGSREPGPRT